MKPIEIVLSKLPTAKKKRNGYEAQCPAHEDERASLSVREGDDGRVLMKCHAGCETEAICKAVNLRMCDLFPKRSRGPSPKKEARIVATYDYRDADGQLVFQVVRFATKDFVQRRPDGKGGWIWNTKGVQRILYRLPELFAANDDKPVFVVEGEKDVEVLRACGCVATCNPGGAGKWSTVDDSPLHGRIVVTIPDNDDAGRKHARAVAKSLLGNAREIRIVELSDVPTKGDVSDWLDAGHTVEDLHALVAQTEPITELDDADDESPTDADDAEPKRRGPSTATVLVELAEQAELFHNANGDAFATIPKNGHVETCALRSKRFKSWLLDLYYTDSRTAPNSQAVQDALNTIEAQAIHEGEQQETHVRRAEIGGVIYLDLCDAEYRVVKVSVDGWVVLDKSPVKFIRRPGMLSLPIPERGGSIDRLRPYVNIPSDSDFALAVAWLIAAARPCGPYPILTVNGEQGSAKSTTCRALRRLIDPNEADLRSQPRDERDLVIAGRNSAVIGFDNLSNIPTWLSDALCRIATGGGFGTRELYTNDEEIILSVQRPIIVNGIEELATRSDLLDRAIQLTLPTIDEADYKPESIFWQEYEAERPYILGALLDAVVTALRNVESVRLAVPTRMADFSHWVMAAEPALPWKAGAFIEAYTGNRASAHELALDSSPVANILRTWIDNEPTETWTGTATELLNALEGSLPVRDGKPIKSDGWPKRSNKLSGQLARLAPNLRAVGIHVSCDREQSPIRVKRWTVTRKAVQTIVQNRPIVQKPHSDDAGRVFSGRSPDDTPGFLDDTNPPDRPPATGCGRSQDDPGRSTDDADSQYRTILDDTDDCLHTHSGGLDLTEVDDVDRAEREAIQGIKTGQVEQDSYRPI